MACAYIEVFVGTWGICYPASCGVRVRPNPQRIMIARRKSTELKFFDVELAGLGTISRLIR